MLDVLRSTPALSFGDGIDISPVGCNMVESFGTTWSLKTFDFLSMGVYVN